MNVPVNLYFTKADFFAWQRITSVDTTDDLVILQIIEAISRVIDQNTGRRFYPSIETHLFDIPQVDFTDRDTIFLDDDLLSLTTFTNGDTTVITNASYILKPANVTPSYAVKLRDSANISWEQNSSNSSEQVISILGIWGYHDKYAKAWLQVGTLGAAMTDTTTLTLTMTAGHSVVAGQIIQIGTEYLNVASVATNTVTVVTRGDNGSTAATQLINAPVSAWQVMPTIITACQQITNSFYKKRCGENVSSAATITAAGVVLTPTDIPVSALKILMPLSRLSWV